MVCLVTLARLLYYQVTITVVNIGVFTSLGDGGRFIIGNSNNMVGPEIVGDKYALYLSDGTSCSFLSGVLRYIRRRVVSYPMA